MNYTPIRSFSDDFLPRATEMLERQSRLAENGCIVWDDSVDEGGYGKFRIPRAEFGRIRMTGSHRASWIVHKGAIPNDFLQIDHLCFNPPCINPEHLDLVTAEENQRRRRGRRRRAGAGGRPRYESKDNHRCKTHGREDGYLKERNDGYFFWACRMCRREAVARYKAKNRKPKTIRLCSVSDCGEKHRALGYCMKHYQLERYKTIN